MRNTYRVVHMTLEPSHISPHESLSWTLQSPDYHSKQPCLAILCGDWCCGMLPYCGPGSVDALWKSEMEFLTRFSRYLNEEGIHTLSLTQKEGVCIPPDDETLRRFAGPGGVLTAIREISGPVSWKPNQMICIGHGLGGYVHCQLASYGIVPAGFVFAAGVFSDYEVIISQKYTMVLQAGPQDCGIDHSSIDPVSVQIGKNLGTILQAIRKGKKRVSIGTDEHRFPLHLEPGLFTGSNTPRSMFRHVLAPTLIIHGSSDLDVSLWNAASIEQSIRKSWVIPERVILPDLDHWFREMPVRPADQIRERLNGDCFKRQIDPRVFEETITFIRKVIAPEAPGHSSPAVPERLKETNA